MPPAPEEPVVHPLSHEKWFQDLPPDYQERWTEDYRRGLVRDQELVQNESRLRWIEIGGAAALFPIVDLLFVPGRSLVIALVLALGGALLGYVWHRTNMAQLASALSAMGAFFLLEIVLRGGVPFLAAIALFPLGGIAGYLGTKRTERPFN